MKKPNIFLSIGIGILGVIVFIGGYILAVYVSTNINMFIILFWFSIWIGAVVGLQIQILRKLDTFETPGVESE